VEDFHYSADENQLMNQREDNNQFDQLLSFAGSLDWLTGKDYSPSMPKTTVGRISDLCEELGNIDLDQETQSKSNKAIKGDRVNVRIGGAINEDEDGFIDPRKKFFKSPEPVSAGSLKAHNVIQVQDFRRQITKQERLFLRLHGETELPKRAFNNVPSISQALAYEEYEVGRQDQPIFVDHNINMISRAENEFGNKVDNLLAGFHNIPTETIDKL